MVYFKCRQGQGTDGFLKPMKSVSMHNVQNDPVFLLKLSGNVSLKLSGNFSLKLAGNFSLQNSESVETDTVSVMVG